MPTWGHKNADSVSQDSSDLLFLTLRNSSSESCLCLCLYISWKLCSTKGIYTWFKQLLCELILYFLDQKFSKSFHYTEVTEPWHRVSKAGFCWSYYTPNLAFKNWVFFQIFLNRLFMIVNQSIHLLKETFKNSWLTVFWIWDTKCNIETSRTQALNSLSYIIKLKSLHKWKVWEWNQSFF